MAAVSWASALAPGVEAGSLTFGDVRVLAQAAAEGQGDVGQVAGGVGQALGPAVGRRAAHGLRGLGPRAQVRLHPVFGNVVRLAAKYEAVLGHLHCAWSLPGAKVSHANGVHCAWSLPGAKVSHANGVHCAWRLPGAKVSHANGLHCV